MGFVAPLVGLKQFRQLRCESARHRRGGVYASIRAPVDDENVPEGHRGLHNELYGDGAEKEHGSGSQPREAQLELDGEEIFDVEVALKVLGKRKVAGVYAVLDEGREVVYVGISRNVAVHLAAHRSRLSASDVRYAQVKTVAFPSREDMEAVRNEWIESLEYVPSGNGEEYKKWTSSIAEASEVAMNDEAKREFESKKSKLKKAMGEVESDEEYSRRQRESNIRSAVEEGDWSAEINRQTEETLNGSNSSSDSVVSPFAENSKSSEISPKKSMVLNKENCDAVLDEVRPYLVADGGNIKVLAVEGGDVKVLLEGACGSCPSSTTTMQMGVEKVLRENFADFNSVTAVSDAEEALGRELSVELCDLVLEQVRPAITGLGGVVRVKVAEGKTIALQYTGPEKLAYGIELMLRDKFPEVTEIRFDAED
mmetsp:Transcript_10479/g.32020  ORF Transcript_10479/g.32020 Transcript_10479/m.32020 type:complete len:425 (+) Transcript_10479:59-1333(+)|eukprot:CAMPEP_0198727266 /NCGR_PEP_ID=MMETSP1475-20131203/4042_1 /TAXON_ID= ORGANISM="Unidentified sp., Strain CCMP1999" /NCGR_SAMPLE_ID=MMETSP1475 /ASSEMBLY_ACC=CAM_ASM_001111 /LENGTH=424 /DNA_ID=CAMNT_0044489277 /DNA_START=43 /DNA_END=1317 /DNA_ORIENTATION=+